MPEIICERSGLTFEAATKRARVHPEVKQWLEWGYKNDQYAAVCTGLKNAREHDAQTIAEVNASIERALQADRDKTQAKAEEEEQFWAQVRANRAAQTEERARRQERNAVLKTAGFYWHKFDPENDDARFGFPPYAAGRWMLIGPDGNEWSEHQAMEVAEGRETIESLKARAQAAEQAKVDEVAGLVKFDDKDGLTVRIVSEWLRERGKRVVVREEWHVNNSVKAGGFAYNALYLLQEDMEAAKEKASGIYEDR